MLKHVVMCLLLSGCSVLLGPKDNTELQKAAQDYEYVSYADYESHFLALKEEFLKEYKPILVKLSPRSDKYLKDLYYRLVNNNEKLLKEKAGEPSVYVLNSKTPFYLMRGGVPLRGMIKNGETFYGHC